MSSTVVVPQKSILCRKKTVICKAIKFSSIERKLTKQTKTKLDQRVCNKSMFQSHWRSEDRKIHWLKLLPLRFQLHSYFAPLNTVCSVASHAPLFVTLWTAACQASLVHETIQTRMLEWVALPSSKESS